MPLSNDPVYFQRPFAVQAVLTGANTDIDDGPDAAVVELDFAGGVDALLEGDGGALTALTWVGRATSTATVAYLYESLDNGATRRVIAVASIAADTASATDAPAQAAFHYNGERITAANPILIPAGAGAAKARYYVGASVALAAGWAVRGQGATLGG